MRTNAVPDKLAAVLLIAAACGHAPSGKTEAMKRTKHAPGQFDEHVAVLQTVDDCDEHDRDTTYTKEDTRFHELFRRHDRTVFVADTSRGCGFTGSCGFRVMLIEQSHQSAKKIGEVCAVSIRILDRKTSGVRDFEYSERGFHAGDLRVRASLANGRLTEKAIFRGHIPYSVLQQLALRDCEQPYDCFSVEQIELTAVHLGPGLPGLVVTAPASVRADPAQDTWPTKYLFAATDTEDYALVHKLRNVETLTFLPSTSNGHFDIEVEYADFSRAVLVRGRTGYDTDS